MVHVPNKGYAGIFEANVAFWVSGISPTTGSKGGEEIIITGNGFNPDAKPTVVVGTIGNCAVSAVTATQITCRVPAHSTYAGYVVKVT